VSGLGLDITLAWDRCYMYIRPNSFPVIL